MTRSRKVSPDFLRYRGTDADRIADGCSDGGGTLLDVAQPLQVPVVRAAGAMERRHLPALRRGYEVSASHRPQHSAAAARHPSETDESAGPLEAQSRLNISRPRCVELSWALVPKEPRSSLPRFANSRTVSRAKSFFRMMPTTNIRAACGITPSICIRPSSRDVPGTRTSCARSTSRITTSSLSRYAAEGIALRATALATADW